MLSLFGYDFDADHQALMKDGSGRVDLKNVAESLILSKPTDADNHEGGKRFDKKWLGVSGLSTLDRRWGRETIQEPKLGPKTSKVRSLAVGDFIRCRR